MSVVVGFFAGRQVTGLGRRPNRAALATDVGSGNAGFNLHLTAGRQVQGGAEALAGGPGFVGSLGFFELG